MSLIAHLAKKDLRRISLPVALFAVMGAAKLILASRYMAEIDYEHLLRLGTYLKVALFVEAVFGYVLVAAIVQEDPTAGTTAFWKTKPISGLRLLSAKLVVLALVLIALPILLTLPWWVSHELGNEGIRGAIMHTIWLQLLLIALALPFAVLTRTLSAYLAWSSGTAIGCFVAVLGASRLHLIDGSFSKLSAGASETRQWLIAVVLLGSICAAVLYQYRTRRTARSVAFATVGVLVVTAVALGWRWDWSALWHRFSEKTETLAALQLHVQSAKLGSDAQPASRRHPHSGGPASSIVAHVSGVPSGHFSRTRALTQSWEWTDGSKTPLHTTFPWRGAESEAVALASLNLASPPTSSVPADRSRALASATHAALPELRSTVPLNDSLLRKIVAQRADLALSAQLHLLKPVLAGEVELREQASVRTDGRLLRVLAVDAKKDQAITVSWLEIVSPSERNGFSGADFFLVDRSLGILVGKTRATTSEQLFVGGVNLVLRNVTFQNERDLSGGHRLVVVAYESIGGTTLRVRIPHREIDVQLAP